MNEMMPIERIENRIYLIRGQKVMLDRDLAELYGVETKYLNRQVRRNILRFPAEYMFQLTDKEKTEVVTNWHHLSGLRFSYQLPYAFAEHGVAMLSAVLNSERAIRISIHIINAFIQLRKERSTHKELADKLNVLESRVGQHDEVIIEIVKEIRRIVEVEEKPAKRIGFVGDEGPRARY